MAQKEEIVGNAASNTEVEQNSSSRRIGISKKVTDHLANERTFLAWIRTGLSIIAFGFVVERFGLLLRELGLRVSGRPIITGHYSTVVGIILTILGTILLLVALFNFLHVRREIDEEHYHPSARFAVVLTIITSLIGFLLAIYLYFTT